MRVFLFLILIGLFSCGKIVKQEKIEMNWRSFDIDLPKGIEIYEGINYEIPLRSWAAVIDLNNPKIKIKILSSSDFDRRETPQQYLNNNINSRLILNGGFFVNNQNPSKHVGLLKVAGFLEEGASPSVYRDGLRYFINRGAFGIMKNGSVDISWCSTKNDSLFIWDKPINNRPGYPFDSLSFKESEYWNPYYALHAGPVLINKGKINVTVEEEVFFNTPVAGVQPRSAIGFTKNNKVVMMVVDGRQQVSRGVYLEELAILMEQFECIEALNLDGGGSSAIVADGRLINKPSGRSSQREIRSAIGVFYYN